MSLYYPKCVVRLRVLWESFDRTDESAKIDEELLKKPQDFTVQAKRVTVDINDYNEADTFSMTLDYKQFPFDPRSMRSVGVSIFIDNSTEEIVASDDNLVFIGFADEQRVVFDDITREVTLEGRDYTSLFIDRQRTSIDKYDERGIVVSRKAAPKLRTSRTIDVIFQQLIDENRSTRGFGPSDGIKVDVRLGGETPPKASFGISASANPERAYQNEEPGMTYWAIMKRIATRAALIIFIEKNKLVITKPRNLYDDFRIVQMTYGINIKSISFHRLLGRQKDFNVQVASSSPELKRNVFAQLPQDARSERFKELFGVKDPKTGRFLKKHYQRRVANPGGSGVEFEPAEFIPFIVPNVSSKERLVEIGEKIYEEISRQQLEGDLGTMEMDFPQVEGTEERRKAISFRDIGVGTTIEVFFRQDDLSAIADIASEGERTKYLVTKGFSQEIAAALAKALTKISYRFYVSGVSISLDNDSGFDFKVRFLNIIETDQISL